MDLTFLFVTQLPCDLFRYWFGRVNSISQNFDAQLKLIPCLRKDLIFLSSLYDICLTVWPSIYLTLEQSCLETSFALLLLRIWITFAAPSVKK